MSPQTDQTIMSTPDFDLLRGTASETRALLDARRITCTQLVQRCLDQMEAHNKAGLHLNALISIAPRQNLLKKAAKLDQELEEGRSRGPLHGTPIIVKLIKRLSCESAS